MSISISNREVLWVDQDEIAVIIPCYNEAQTIGKVVDDFKRELPAATIYVYDNDSTDATSYRDEARRDRSIRTSPRQGKRLSADVPRYRCRLLPHGGRR